MLHTRRLHTFYLFAFAAASVVAGTVLCAVLTLPPGNVVVAVLDAAKTSPASSSPSPEATGPSWQGIYCSRPRFPAISLARCATLSPAATTARGGWREDILPVALDDNRVWYRYHQTTSSPISCVRTLSARGPSRWRHCASGRMSGAKTTGWLPKRSDARSPPAVATGQLMESSVGEERRNATCRELRARSS